MLGLAIQNLTIFGANGHHGVNVRHVLSLVKPHSALECAKPHGVSDLHVKSVFVKYHLVQPGEHGQNGQSVPKHAVTVKDTDQDFAYTATNVLDHQRKLINVKIIHHVSDGSLGVNGVNAIVNAVLDRKLVNVSAITVDTFKNLALVQQATPSNVWIVLAVNGQTGTSGCRATEAVETANNIVYVSAIDLAI